MVLDESCALLPNLGTGALDHADPGVLRMYAHGPRFSISTEQPIRTPPPCLLTLLEQTGNGEGLVCLRAALLLIGEHLSVPISQAHEVDAKKISCDLFIVPLCHEVVKWSYLLVDVLAGSSFQRP